MRQIRQYQKNELRHGLKELGEQLGSGIAWAGFWIGVGLLLMGMCINGSLKWPEVKATQTGAEVQR